MLAGRYGFESEPHPTGFFIAPCDPSRRTGHGGTGELNFDFKPLMIANRVVDFDLDATFAQIVGVAIKSTPVFCRGRNASETRLQSVTGEASLFHDRAGHPNTSVCFIGSFGLESELRRRSPLCQ